jgi:imidazole glycerol phosphate synthase subunit HisF
MRVANERGAICVQCPLNAKYDVPWFEDWSNNVAIASVGDKQSQHHADLWTCSACSCPLKAKVFFNGKIELTKEQEKVIKETNPKCWQLSENK